MTGMVWDWIGVGVSKPSAFRFAAIGGEKWNLSKFTESPLAPPEACSALVMPTVGRLR
jgi:hypothetical protein